MPHLNFRPAAYIPPEHRREVLTRFTKADLAEIAWDFAVQAVVPEGLVDGDSLPALGRRVLAELERRRTVVRAATQ